MHTVFVSAAPARRAGFRGARAGIFLALATALSSVSTGASASASDALASIQAPAPAPTPDAAATAAAKAAEAARLKAEFDRESAQLRDAVAAFQAELIGLQQRAVPREKWPPHPNVVAYPRFEALAFQDQPDALRWCLTALGQLGITAPEVAERKADIYARLVVLHCDVPWVADAARWIQSDGSPAGIGFERADELLRALAEGTTLRPTRAAALAARAAMYEPRTDPASRAEYLKLVHELAEKHGDTPAGANAQGTLFRAEFLVPGKVLPEVAEVDTEDKPVRLADYRGKVLVLDFWGFWCGVCVKNLPHLKELAQRHANDPFAILGVATDRDAADFRRQAHENGITWRNAWAGGTSGRWPTSWGIQRYPSVFVLDGTGAVRFVDVRGPELDRAVDFLLAELRAQKAPEPR